MEKSIQRGVDAAFLVLRGGSRQSGELIDDERRQLLIEEAQHQIAPRVEDAVDAEIKLGQVELENVVLEKREKTFAGRHRHEPFSISMPRSS